MTDTVRVFVSYSRKDEKHLDKILEHLKILEAENVEFWTDRQIRAGKIWDEVIKANIWDADIALALVSQTFLDSDYCQKEEINSFLKQKTYLFPIILSRCDWQCHDWLRIRQSLPGHDETIDEHYTDPGCCEQLFSEIIQQLKDSIKSVRTLTYKHDVFVSYCHYGQWYEWLKERFKPVFEHYLLEELARPVEVYIDSNNRIGNGNILSSDLYHLGNSAVLVSCWSPHYFNSPWRAELAHMLAREEEEKSSRCNCNRNNSLILPVKLHDGEQFPNYISTLKHLKQFDLRDYARLHMPKESDKWAQFEGCIIDLAQIVKVAIIGARPRPHPAWIDTDWNNKAAEKFLPLLDASPKQTTLPG